ncbi:palmitoyl-protein thioesterase/dolichyldiphosphatase 1 [Holotrichia oblita]|uniref:Palmitoyl-protein thioesterase/dolichyldiphosphatase 1 n=1 Tax=Holotrichia oblita TaxID=644536 RepID=A0ACB9TTW7_HOLOL|nr:palmitoyl-protein thioesterase/dolichyldiphosphatase 1 [Holotrichia oblita]
MTFRRALVQRCEGAKVKNLISLGGQHQGVYGVPNCPKLLFPVCDLMKWAINFGGYWSFFQEKFVQFTFWHNPLNEKAYIEHSTFLADINNEKQINQEYVERLKKLENFVMVKYENDQMVIPVESSWFGFYEPGQAKKVLALKETRIYLDDQLGLREMDHQKKLHFLSFPGGHLQGNWDLFKQNIIEKFLRTLPN